MKLKTVTKDRKTITEKKQEKKLNNFSCGVKTVSRKMTTGYKYYKPCSKGKFSFL